MHLIQTADPAGKGLEMTSGLLFVRDEAGHGDLRLIGEALPQKRKLRIQRRQGVLPQLRDRFREPGRLRDLPLEARQGREGQKLSRPLGHGHGQVLLRHGSGPVYDIVVGAGHVSG